MNTGLKAAISLIALGGVSTGGYILAGNYNDDAPIYNTKPTSTLLDTKEIFRSGDVGNKFPSIFLSTRAVSNNKDWEAKKKIVTKFKDKWTNGSFFSDIKDDQDTEIITKIKTSCLNAYKAISPETDSSKKTGYFLIAETKWWEVWMMCGAKTTKPVTEETGSG